MKALLRNLKDQILTEDKAIMYCPICGAEYSANSGDYWNITDPDHEFRCCGEVMELVIRRTIYEVI